MIFGGKSRGRKSIGISSLANFFKSQNTSSSIQNHKHKHAAETNRTRMNQVLVPRDGSFCSWGYPCVYQYYSYLALGALVVVAATQFFVVKICRIKTVLVSTRSSVSFLIMLFLVVIQWRYLIAASQYVPKSMFAANILHSLDCDNSTKGGKKRGSYRDCYSGQLMNCSNAVPCTVCNPVEGMDSKAVWNWWINQRSPCSGCNTSSTECTSFEQESICSKTFNGPLFDGTIRTKAPLKTLEEIQYTPPLEFWRTKHRMVTSIVCFVVLACVLFGFVKRTWETFLFLFLNFMFCFVGGLTFCICSAFLCLCRSVRRVAKQIARTHL